MSEPQPIRVVIVDDSKTIRAILRRLLEDHGGMQVVGEAGDPYEARDVIKATNPDVITLDVEMPRMNGLDFLERLMRLRPMPVVMVSNRTSEKSEAAVRALALGAVDCIDLSRLHADPDAANRVTETVGMAARASVRSIDRSVGQPMPRSAAEQAFDWNGRIVVIGSSTGGVDALETVFSAYPADCPPTLVAQHMPGPFLESFARRLNELMTPTVRLAEDGAKLEQGTILIAPGATTHLVLGRAGSGIVHLREDAGQERYVPSVRCLFASAEAHGSNIVAVMLTGMGRDGAEEMLRLKEAGAETIIQSSESCVIDGMPGSARRLGAGTQDVALNQIGDAILKSCAKRTRQRQHV